MRRIRDMRNDVRCESVCMFAAHGPHARMSMSMPGSPRRGRRRASTPTLTAHYCHHRRQLSQHARMGVHVRADTKTHMWHTTASQALPSSPLPTSHAPPLSAALRMAPPEPETLAPAEHRRSIANPKHHPPPRCPLMPARPPSHHRRWAEPHPTAAPLLRQSARSRWNSPPPATDSHYPPVFIAARPGPTPPRIALCNRPTSCGGE